MKKTIFFSWASDFNSSISHKEMILNCLKIAAILKGNKELSVISTSVTDEEIHIVEYELNEDSQLIPKEYEIQTATSGELGSPSIKDTIFDRIARCSLYVCDVSIAISEKEINLNTEQNAIIPKLSDKKNGRKSPNPNVMIELGYAIHTLGWNKILMFFDSSEYKPEDLPFDIKQHVPVFFKSKDIDRFLETCKRKCNNFRELQEQYIHNANIKIIIDKLVDNFDSLDTLIEDEMQFRIDSIFLSLLKSYSDVLYCLESDYYGLDHLLNISTSELESLIHRADGLFFGNISYPYKDFCKDNNKTYQLDKIIDLLITSNIYKKSWIKVLIKLKYFITRNGFISNVLNGSISSNFPNNVSYLHNCLKSFIKIIDITKEWLKESDRDKFQNLNCMTPHSYGIVNFSQTNRNSHLWTYSYEEPIEDVVWDYEEDNSWIQEQEEELQARIKSADPSDFIDRYIFEHGEKKKIGTYLDGIKI
ncbi:MAG: hypothetical protein IKO99_13175 [Bacteroidales bacterium]|nr:hypothetical protein [Bacteroidales bacterium]